MSTKKLYERKDSFEAPTPPERIPIYPNQVAELRKLIVETAGTSISKSNLEKLCYIVRRSYGQGYADRKRKIDEEIKKRKKHQHAKNA